MYILVLDDVPAEFVPVISAHASLACYLKYEDDHLMQKWLKSFYKKVVCTVNKKEFETAKTFENSIVLTESALDDREVAIVFCPRNEWPKPFRFYKLWKPKYHG